MSKEEFSEWVARKGGHNLSHTSREYRAAVRNVMKRLSMKREEKEWLQ